MKRREKVFVGLSGGVDSAVSAALLQKKGYEVTGLFAWISLPGYPCTAAEDRLEALRVAAHLRIPLEEVDLSEAYRKKIFDYTIASYARGETPNPDALCNREIKFGLLYDFAMERGADFFATGHYARTLNLASSPRKKEGRLNTTQLTIWNGGVDTHAEETAFAMPKLVSGYARTETALTETYLLAGADANKDQSYFLWAVATERLARTLFPIGDLEKTAVRALAQKFNLPNALRPDSQGLCFLGDVSIEQAVVRELHTTPGRVLDVGGHQVGEHHGAQLYTLGQRHGFEIRTQQVMSTPHYVVETNVANNTIVVADAPNTSTHARKEIALRDANWIGEVEDGSCEVRYRYRQPLVPAILTREDSLTTVVLSEPRVVPAGQSLVLYRGKRALGGGTVVQREVRNKV